MEDHLDELAHHYSRSDNSEKAVEYLGRAGQQALQRSAYADAISRLSAALDLLHKLPDSPERIRRELTLQLAVAAALMTVRGMAAPEVERAYTRARELCERLGDPPELFTVLMGLNDMHLNRGEFQRAYEIGEQLLRLAQSANDPALLLCAQVALGDTSYWMGEFLLAREQLEMAISLYDPERHQPPSVGYDLEVDCLLTTALTLWHLGYPDQALKRCNEALALAQALSHPFSLAFAEFFVGVLHHLRRDAGIVQETAESAIAICEEHGFTQFLD